MGRFSPVAKRAGAHHKQSASTSPVHREQLEEHLVEHHHLVAAILAEIVSPIVTECREDAESAGFESESFISQHQWLDGLELKIRMLPLTMFFEVRSLPTEFKMEFQLRVTTMDGLTRRIVHERLSPADVTESKIEEWLRTGMNAMGGPQDDASN